MLESIPPQAHHKLYSSHKILEYLSKSNFRKVDFREESEILKYQGITDAKDIHIIAATFKSRAEYLVTLDKKHLLKLEGEDFPFKIVTPGEFLKKQKY